MINNFYVRENVLEEYPDSLQLNTGMGIVLFNERSTRPILGHFGDGIAEQT